MIQRIQSLYLLVAAILLSVTIFLPLMTFLSADTLVMYKVSPLTISPCQGLAFSATWALSVILGASAIILLISLFLFKKRSLQMRLSGFSILLNIGFYVLLAFYLYLVYQQNSSGVATSSLCVGIILPAIASIVTYLAIRAIGKDEVLVQSLNRLR